MKRRRFLQWLGAGALAAAGWGMAGCAFRTRHSSLAGRPEDPPWRCAHCGLLMRSARDLSRSRCPRCLRPEMERISEAELQALLAE